MWAQSSKEMHNAGRLMTWNVSHESILINWSRKDLPWKESPQKLASSLFIPRASPRARAVSGQRRLLSDGGRKAPTCMTALRPVSTIQFSAYHLSLLFAFSLLSFFFFPFTLESYTELSLLKQKLFKQFTQTHPEMCGSNEKLAQFSLDAIPAWSTMPDCLLLPDFMIIRNICKKKTTASEWLWISQVNAKWPPSFQGMLVSFCREQEVKHFQMEHL